MVTKPKAKANLCTIANWFIHIEPKNRLNINCTFFEHLLLLAGSEFEKGTKHTILFIQLRRKCRVNSVPKYHKTPLIRKLVFRIANYLDRLGTSGKSFDNSTKITCLEITGYRIKYSTLLSSRWRYSPGWALASATICLQASRFLALSLHSFIPIFLRSMDTLSSHLILGLPLRLVAYSFPYNIFFRDCGVLHSFYMTKPSYSLEGQRNSVLNYCPRI